MIFAKPKFSQFCLSVYCLVGVFVAMQGTVCAHVYEDGFVERSLTITIRDGVGYGEYRIGLNSKTAQQLLSSAEQQKQKIARQQLLKAYHAAPDSLSIAPQEILLPKKGKGDKVDKPNKTADLKTDAKTNSATGAKTDLASKPSTIPKESVTVGSGEHLTDLQTIKRFGELQGQWFAGRLKLTSNGRSIKLSKVSVEPAARHPYSVMVKFQFAFDRKVAAQDPQDTKASSVKPKPDPAGNQVVDFQVSDGLFAGYSGASRYALRTRGKTMLLQSNVAPALVRAERVEIDQKAATSNERLPAIKAKLNVGGR